jgi:protein-S-isoprenylcysteine O-methyltransferase Ste14
MGPLLLIAQGLFLGVFVVRVSAGRRAHSSTTPRAQKVHVAPRAWALLVFHTVGVMLVSLGITQMFISQRGRFFVSPGALVGLGFLLAGSALAGWALRVFTSWRLLARVDAGHALCVDGPYRFVRHPIYLAMDLWALGSALTCPGAATIVGAVVIFAGSELRARAEERLLTEVFGDDYRAYAARVRRLVPGVY